VHGRDPAALDVVHGEIERDGGRAIRVAADVTSYAEIEVMRPVPYAAAKAGIEMLTRDLALQAGPFGIRVNGIAPETILTERNMGLIGAALFLVSRDADWMTGVILDVAGGAQ
jgi:NAD(P)-dependent dehydrogenase (short-subunit alcohol dehydrogenase family)